MAIALRGAYYATATPGSPARFSAWRLEAAHIVAKQFDGCDDPRNGLVLCRNHHRALDKALIAINPDTLALELRCDLDSSALGVTRTSIAHLRALPAPEALRIAYGAEK